MPAMLPVTIAIAVFAYACGRAMQRHKNGGAARGRCGAAGDLGFL